MSATFKLAKQKQNDLRRLMSEQKSKQQVQVQTKKIDSPLAKYPFQLNKLTKTISYLVSWRRFEIDFIIKISLTKFISKTSIMRQAS